MTAPASRCAVSPSKSAPPALPAPCAPGPPARTASAKKRRAGSQNAVMRHGFVRVARHEQHPHIGVPHPSLFYSLRSAYLRHDRVRQQQVDAAMMFLAVPNVPRDLHGDPRRAGVASLERLEPIDTCGLWMRVPSAHRASPSARCRSRRRATGGGRRNWRPVSGCAKRTTRFCPDAP